MRILPAFVAALFASPAAAHPGHWGELAGHDHWVAGAAIGLAGLAALWGILKGKKEESAEDESADAAEEEPA